MASIMREADKLEVDAAGQPSPQAALIRGFLESRPCLTVEHAGTPAAIFGVVPVQGVGPKVGIVWLLGTDAILKFRSTFLRDSRAWLEDVSKDYDMLMNCIDARNELHIRWVKWLGFTFVAQHDKFGPYGLPFLEFVRIKPQCVTPP
jgi:hypothetical protein